MNQLEHLGASDPKDAKLRTGHFSVLVLEIMKKNNPDGFKKIMDMEKYNVVYVLVNDLEDDGSYELRTEPPQKNKKRGWEKFLVI